MFYNLFIQNMKLQKINFGGVRTYGVIITKDLHIFQLQ